MVELTDSVTYQGTALVRFPSMLIVNQPDSGCNPRPSGVSPVSSRSFTCLHVFCQSRAVFRHRDCVLQVWRTVGVTDEICDSAVTRFLYTRSDLKRDLSKQGTAMAS